MQPEKSKSKTIFEEKKTPARTWCIEGLYNSNNSNKGPSLETLELFLYEYFGRAGNFASPGVLY